MLSFSLLVICQWRYVPGTCFLCGAQSCWSFLLSGFFLGNFFPLPHHHHNPRNLNLSLLLTSLLDCNNKFMNVSRLPGTRATEGRMMDCMGWYWREQLVLRPFPLLLSYVKFFALSVIETYPEKYCPTNAVASLLLQIFRVPTFFCLKQWSGPWSGSACIHIDFGRLDPDPEPCFGCSLFKAEGCSSCWDVLHVGL